MAQLFLVGAQHSTGLVLLAALICTIMAGLVILLIERTRSYSGRWRAGWMAAIAVIAGVGVWTTHFIAMLGFRPDITFGYDPLLTIVSAVLAVAAVGIPLAAAAAVPRSYAMACGALAGLGIGAMHYTGMAALEGCVVTHSAKTIFLSLGFGASVAALALRMRPSGWRYLSASLLLVLAVCSLHFTAVAGVSVTAAPLLPGSFVFQPTALGGMVAGAAVMIFVAASAVALGQIKLEQRDARLAAGHAELLSTAMNNMSNGLVMIGSDGLIKLYNDRVIALLHMRPGDINNDMPLRDFIANVGRCNNWDEDRIARVIANHHKWMAQTEVIRIEQNFDNGGVLSITCRPFRGGAILTYNDLRKDREVQKKMAHMAHHDVLTGLPNRRAFQLRLRDAVEQTVDVSLLILDLDNFKDVNDSLGHPMGDTLLVRASERLQQACGPNEFLARLGGDELAVVLQDGGAGADTELAERLMAVLARPFEIQATLLRIGCSIGVANLQDLPAGPEAPDSLMQYADLALYKAKANGRGRVQRFMPGMAEEAAEQRRLEADIAAALEKDQFSLAYQPLFAVSTNEIIGFEALIRWHHPERGFVPPDRFIPAAERSGHIAAIGEWVLKEACREVASWPAGIHVAIIVSPLQLHSNDFLVQVTRALADNRLSPDRLEIELTETAMVEDGAQIAATLTALRALGIKVAMDDFGTGYSSLAHLRHFELDRIKIDRSFVETAPSDPGSMAVLRAVTQIGQELGLMTVGEGIETEEQLEILRSLGCDMGQGYLLGRPISADKVSALLRDTSVQERKVSVAL